MWTENGSYLGNFGCSRLPWFGLGLSKNIASSELVFLRRIKTTATERISVMKTYDDYFSDDAIIATLCRIRLNRAGSIHRRRFFRKAFEVEPEKDFSDLNRLFPPRKLWHDFRPKKEERKNCSQPNFKAVVNCIRRFRNTENPPKWAADLNAFVAALQRRVFTEGEFMFRTPDVVPQPKSSKNEYRAIASFPNIEDKVVDIINAKYLRERLEVCLEDASRAFRSGGKRHLDRNSAIDDIYRIRDAHPSQALFVTECDIRGFFDCVHHPVAKEALHRTIGLLKVRNPEATIDSRAIKIFDRYLDCYSFSQTVLRLENDLQQRMKNSSARYKWPIGGDAKQPNTLNHFHKRPKGCRIGVPQGGAHSCLIANLILDLADKEVLLSLQSSRGTTMYLRYCDDIIIVCSDEGACKRATEAYYRALCAVKLPYHLPTELNGSAEQFFESSKTKECYRWGEKHTERIQFPWIQFLGYQMRYDGRIRIRPSSLDKQRSKIETLGESLRQRVNHQIAKVSHRRLLYRFNSKLWAFSSGRVQLHTEHQEPLPMCWASGFRQLSKRPFHARHVRKLDQVAGKERRRLMRHLKKFQSGATGGGETAGKNQVYYFGKPFSHLRQFDFPIV